MGNESALWLDCEFNYCSLEKFSGLYGATHKPLTFSICAFGTVANALNIIVLGQKHMNTPTNTLLTGLSLAQLLLVSNYIALQTFQSFRDSCIAGWTQTGAWYMYINVNCNLVCHTVAFTHTLTISIFRYMSIRWPAKTRAMLQSQRPWQLSLLIYIVVPFLCIPVYFTSNVARTENHSVCITDSYDLVFADDPVLMSAVFWLFGIVFKLIPCTLIAVFSGLLINSIRKANIRKQRLFQKNYYNFENGPELTAIPRNSRANSAVSCDSISRVGKSRPKRGPTVVRSRTTRMLVAVACGCFIVEFSHGILNLLTGIYGANFADKVYNQLGDFFEMLTLLYSSINFVLYCAMSTDFQRAFANLFCPILVRNFLVNSKTTRKKKLSYRQRLGSRPIEGENLLDVAEFRKRQEHRKLTIADPVESDEIIYAGLTKGVDEFQTISEYSSLSPRKHNIYT